MSCCVIWCCREGRTRHHAALVDLRNSNFETAVADLDPSQHGPSLGVVHQIFSFQCNARLKAQNKLTGDMPTAGCLLQQVHHESHQYCPGTVKADAKVLQALKIGLRGSKD